jgi:hypothetical protein
VAEVGGDRRPYADQTRLPSVQLVNHGRGEIDLNVRSVADLGFVVATVLDLVPMHSQAGFLESIPGGQADSARFIDPYLLLGDDEVSQFAHLCRVSAGRIGVRAEQPGTILADRGHIPRHRTSTKV